jgi:hypothetical protein
MLFIKIVNSPQLSSHPLLRIGGWKKDINTKSVQQGQLFGRFRSTCADRNPRKQEGSM